MAVYASMCLDRPAGRPKPTPRNSRIRECAQPRVTGVRRRRGPGTNELARTRGGKTPHRVDMDAELLDEIRRNLNQCRVFGADRFKEEIEAMLQRLV
jgi:hypothetical protein